MVIDSAAISQLWIKAKNGDSKAENEVFAYLFVRFKRFAKRKIKEKEDAKDLAQDAIIVVLQKYKTMTFTTGFEAWAYGILKNKIGNYLQKEEKRRKNVVDSSFIEKSTKDSNIMDPNLVRLITECLKKILQKSQRYARVLNLIYQGYKANEIARKLNIKRNNVYTILNRGRSLLKYCINTGQV